MNAMIAALGSGLFASGVLLMWRGVFAPATPLDVVVVDLHRPRATPTSAVVGAEHRWVPMLAGPTSATRQQDLAVCGHSQSKWAWIRMTWAMFGCSPPLTLFFFIASGLWPFLSIEIAFLLLPAGCVAGWAWATIDLRSDAESARRRFRNATAGYLELVTILMAGGAGPESAMFDAAEIGQAPAFRHIRTALATSRMRREDPWTGLGRVGQTMGVDDLIELEATMRLAAGGAKVKGSLAAKAASMRERDLAKVEASANASTETMVLPVALMFAGFMVLLGYPALAGLSAT